MIPWICFKELMNFDNKSVSSLAGGKGYGLAAIHSLGLSYPQTWVVTSGLHSEFVNCIRGEIREITYSEAVKFILNRIGPDLELLPKGLYAVRSSADVEDSYQKSFAGMFESKLNVPVDTLPEAVANIWLSAVGGRVSKYKADDKIPQMAVLIQPMIQASFSGVCFSVHPSPGNFRENTNVLIEFIQGTGEQLVQGEATPRQLNLTYGQEAPEYPWIRELLSAVKKIELSTGVPVDVEFAVDYTGKLWILQQRPVTTAVKSSIIDMSGYKKSYKRSLCTLDIEFLIDGCARHLASYLEIPVDLKLWMVMLTNEKDGQQELWINESIEEAVISHICHRIRLDIHYAQRLKQRYQYHHRMILNWETSLWAAKSCPNESQRPSLDDRLSDFFEFIAPVNAHYYAPMHIIEALSGMIVQIMKNIDRDHAEDDFFLLTTTGVITLGQLFSLDCRRLKNEIAEQCGGSNTEMNLLPPELQTRLGKLCDDYAFLNCHQPYESPYTVDQVYERINSLTDDQLPEGQAADIACITAKYENSDEWRYLFENLNHWLNIRNQQMEYLYYVYAKAAPLLSEAGEKLGMSLKEVWNSNRNFLLESIAKGRTPARSLDRKMTVIAHDGINVLVTDSLNPVFPSTGADESIIRGRTAFGGGKVTGTVRVVFTPEQLKNALAESADLIVVTGMTTPDFVPWLENKVAGLITDEGGILCHAAIIAREIRIPCIVGTGCASETLRDGMIVTLDLDKGEAILEIYE